MVIRERFTATEWLDDRSVACGGLVLRGGPEWSFG